MPIEGPIRELAPSDLLQLLFLSRRTGRLTVEVDEEFEITLEIRDGALIRARGNPDLWLGRLLVRSGRATESQVERALRQQKKEPGRPIGEILVHDGVVRSAEIERQLRFQVEETVFDLMRIEEGHLTFEESRTPAKYRIEIAMATDAVLMNAARRLDEYTEVLSGISKGDPLPRLAAASDAGEGTLSLQPLEWEVLAEIDGARTLRTIARSIGRAELEVARALYGLVAAGIVDVGSHGDEGDAGGEAERRAAYATVDLAIREGRRAEAEVLVGALPKRPDDAEDVERCLLEGRLLALKEDWPAALRNLERALELDPLSAEACFHLARTALRAGDLERTRQALDTYDRLHDSSAARAASAARISALLADLLAAANEGEL